MEQHFVVNEKTKTVKIKDEARKVSESALTAKQAACPHTDVNHKGSNAWVKRTNCNLCGLSWNEKRQEAPVTNPDTCKHRNTDNRGSTKDMLCVYCKDCQTYVERVPKGVADRVNQEEGRVLQTLNEDERYLLEHVEPDATFDREIVVNATLQMVQEVEELAPGQYRMVDILIKMADCLDLSLIHI